MNRLAPVDAPLNTGAIWVGRASRSAGSPQARLAPLRDILRQTQDDRTHEVGSVGACFDAAILDLDGTLVDTVGDFVAALNLMLADLRPALAGTLAVDAAIVTEMVGKGSGHLIRSVLNHLQAQGPLKPEVQHR